MQSERTGILMIAASLIAIAIIVAVTSERQAAARRAQVHEQGVSLVRLLSRLPYEQLTPTAGNAGLLQAALQSGRATDLGYGAIVDLRGATVTEITSAGTIVPPAPPSGADDAQIGVRALTSPGDARHITEFYGPLLSGGNVVGQVRVGFLDASQGLPGAEQLSFIALLALPVFLLVALFHFMLKREMRPLGDIGRDLQRLAASGATPVAELGMSSDLREFAGRFNGFVETLQARFREQEAERLTSTVSNRMLAYRQEKLESLLHALPEAILVIDESGRITHANAKLEPILGVAHESLAGRNVQEITAAPELSAFLARCRISPGQPFRGATMELSPAAQPERRIAAGAYPLFSPREPGSVLGVLVAFRDVTQEFLARSSGAEFVAHVAHELKSPLNVLHMYSELLLDTAAQPETQRIEALNVIHDEVGRMAGLIDNLLNVSRLETGNVALDRQRVKLRDLIEDVFAEVGKHATGKDVRLELDLPQELSPVLLDKDMFRIAIVNLLNNAIKYNRPGGSVTLAAEETDTQVLVRVRDTGIGIPAADQAQVFDKFFRSDNAVASGRSGHGLGLYLAR